MYDLQNHFSTEDQGFIIRLDSPYQIQHVFFACAKHRKNFDFRLVIEDFNKGVKRLKEDGTYQAILRKHGNTLKEELDRCGGAGHLARNSKIGVSSKVPTSCENSDSSIRKATHRKGSSRRLRASQEPD